MLLGGDELGRTQGGNNNSWFTAAGRPMTNVEWAVESTHIVLAPRSLILVASRRPGTSA